MISILIQLALTFPGGNDNELVASMAKQLNKPVAVLSVARRKWPAMRETGKDLKQLVSEISRSQIVTFPEVDIFGFRKKGFPDGVLNQNWAQSYLYWFKNPPEVIRPDKLGNYTYSTARDIGLPVSMIELPERRKLRWHWFFGIHRVALSVRNVRADELLDCAAAAIGARVVHRPTEEYLDIDWTQFKRSVKEWVPEQVKLGKADGPAKVKIFGKFVADASAETLARLYAKPGGEVTLEVTSSLIYSRLVDEAISANLAADPNFAAALSQLGDNPVQYVILSSEGRASIKLYNKEGKRAFVF